MAMPSAMDRSPSFRYPALDLSGGIDSDDAVSEAGSDPDIVNINALQKRIGALLEPFLADADNPSPDGSGVLPIPRVVVVEKGSFSAFYLRVRDWLVDQFPSLDNWLSEGERNSGEKAQLYALKVRDTIRELAMVSRDSDQWQELAHKVRAFATIAGNASKVEEDLYQEFSSAPPSFLLDEDVEYLKGECKAEAQAAKFYGSFAEDLAAVFVSAGSESGQAFDRLLNLFCHKGETETADRLVDFVDLPFLAKAAKDCDSDDDVTPRSDALRRVLDGERQKVSLEIRTLPRKVEGLRETMKLLRDEVVQRPGVGASHDIDDPGRELSVGQDSRAPAADARTRAISTAEDMIVHIRSLKDKAERLREEMRYLDNARAALNSSVEFKGASEIRSEGDTKHGSPGTPSASPRTDALLAGCSSQPFDVTEA